MKTLLKILLLSVMPFVLLIMATRAFGMESMVFDYAILLVAPFFAFFDKGYRNLSVFYIIDWYLVTIVIFYFLFFWVVWIVSGNAL